MIKGNGEASENERLTQQRVGSAVGQHGALSVVAHQRDNRARRRIDRLKLRGDVRGAQCISHDCRRAVTPGGAHVDDFVTGYRYSDGEACARSAASNANARGSVARWSEWRQTSNDHVQHDVAYDDDSTDHDRRAKDTAISPAKVALATTRSRLTCTLAPAV